MKYEDGKVVETFEKPDGQRRVELIERADGNARFVELALLHDEYAGDYWSSAHHSGVYADVTAARDDLKKIIYWLRPE